MSWPTSGVDYLQISWLSKKNKIIVFKFVYKVAECCFHYFIKSTWSHASKQQH